MLTALGVGRQEHVDGRAAVCALVDREPPVEGARPLGDRVEAPAAPLPRGVVGDGRVEAAVPGALHADRDPLRRATPDGLVQRFADYLVDARLGLLGQGL